MSQTPSPPAAPLVEHFFRHEAGRLVSVLTRIFGWRHFELVEDMVQATLLEALQSWRIRGVPDNPSAWVHRVARNKFVDAAIEDSQLRMMFACCHPRLARENQLALTLKALCGFGISEIARALLVGEETIKKRLQRATRELAELQVSLEPPGAEELAGRL